MAGKTYAQITAGTDVQDADLLATYRATGPLKAITATILAAYMAVKNAAVFLSTANNLSELTSTAATARGNLGLGSAATHPVADFAQTANNLSDLGSAATARTNLGAAPLSAPSFTGGVTLTGGATYTGSTKANVAALGALNIDLTASDFFTKAISTNSTFTFSGATASTGQAFILDLTISSAAVPTWPVSVKWPAGTAPTLGNGRHILGFLSDDGGTSWAGLVCALNIS